MTLNIYAEKMKEYTDILFKAAMESDFNRLGEVADILIKNKNDGKRVYIAGNGGSAATASHMANDLVKGCRVGNNTGFRAIALTDPMPILTCLANDFSYDEVFSIQLETHAEAGDLLIVFSGSGNSPNILKAVAAARKKDMKIIGFTGRTGGKLEKICDISVIAPSDCMEQIEDLHMFYEHGLITVIREQLAGSSNRSR